jgi:hypothetical protein
MPRPSRLAIAYSALFALACAFPGTTLFSGQVIKQFETYSLAESLAHHGPDPYGTTIPCDGTIRWVLELPLFAELAAPFVRLFPSVPAVAPLLVFALFLWGLARLRRRLLPDGSELPWMAAAATPVFLRFSTQFLPDPLAVALLAHGAAVALGGRRGAAHALFLAAVSVKPTVLPSIAFFRIALEPGVLDAALSAKRRLAAAIWAGAASALYALPFALWALSLRWKGIPSPMHEGGLLAIGRDWNVLLTSRFYTRFLVWIVFKGAGPALVAIGLVALPSFRDWPRNRKLLALWSAGILPYWLLVRSLNIVHDYYSLSFLLPIALLCAHAADGWLARGGRPRMLARAALAVAILHGVALFVKSGSSNPPRPVSDRPVFCGPEMRAEPLLHLGPANGN